MSIKYCGEFLCLASRIHIASRVTSQLIMPKMHIWRVCRCPEKNDKMIWTRYGHVGHLQIVLGSCVTCWSNCYCSDSTVFATKPTVILTCWNQWFGSNMRAFSEASVQFDTDIAINLQDILFKAYFYGCHIILLKKFIFRLLVLSLPGAVGCVIPPAPLKY